MYTYHFSYLQYIKDPNVQESNIIDMFSHDSEVADTEWAGDAVAARYGRRRP